MITETGETAIEIEIFPASIRILGPITTVARVAKPISFAGLRPPRFMDFRPGNREAWSRHLGPFRYPDVHLVIRDFSAGASRNRRQYSLVMSMQRTDEELMIAVREGRLDQLEPLFGRYRDSLYDFFSRLTGNRVASEDLVQEVFVRILKYRGSYREPNRFVTWMYQIARNARADHLRKHRIVREDAAFAGPERGITMPSRQLEENEEKALLDAQNTHRFKMP